MTADRITTPSDPQVSVIVAVRNGAATIGEAVDSLRALDFPAGAMEIVVVDNASTDETPRILEAMGDHVRVLHENRRGAGAARNCGIRAARGHTIAFTDGDAVVEPGWLKALVAPLSDPTVGIVGGPILSVEPCNRIERFGERIHNHKAAIEQRETPYAMTGNWASRRDVLLQVGLFEESLLRGQDVDLAWRIRDAGYRLVYEPAAIVRHRNERTLAGLFHEGFVHGLHGALLMERHGRPRPRKRARLLRAIRQAAREESLIDGALVVLFDAGKVTGQLVAQWRRHASVRPRNGGRSA